MQELSKSNTDLIIADQLKLAVQAKTYQDLILTKSLRLESISDRYGAEIALKLVLDAISSLCSAMAFNTTPEMRLEAATMILDDFPDTKLAAFHVFKKEVLYGRIGKPGKTFRMDAKVLLEFWNEFYTKMTETICDHIEAKHKDFYPPDKPVNEDKIIPMPEYVKETFKRVTEKMRVNSVHEDENRPSPSSKLTLDQIAEAEGVNIELLAEVIRTKAKNRMKGDKVDFALALQAEMASTLYEARKDPKHLNRLIQSV